MASERRLRAVSPGDDPIWRLWEQLPPEWRGPVIGDGIDDWLTLSERGQKLNLTGLPGTIAAEMAWMAHWQAQDGTLVLDVDSSASSANILRQAMREGHPFPPSIRAMDWETASASAGLVLRHRHRGGCQRRDSRAVLRRRVRLLPAGAAGPLPRRARGGNWMSGTHGATHAYRWRHGSPRVICGCSPSQISAALAAGSGEVASGHDAGIRHPAVGHGQRSG